MINDILKDAEQRMEKCIANLLEDFNKVRTGRAHPDILAHVKVSYYGSDTPLTQLANVTTADAQTLSIRPWEKNIIPEIEKAIREADLGLNSVTAGEVIRVPMPPLSEERRKDFVKLVKNEAENARIAIRNVRRDANADIKDLTGEISEDDQRVGETKVQDLTNGFIKRIDEALAKKEDDLMEI